MIDFAILGPLQATGGNGTIAITGQKESAVLAALVLASGRVVSVDSLCAAVWGDDAPRSSAKVIQNLVLRLRKNLGTGVIETASGGYRLHADVGTIDSVRFETMVREGREHVRCGDWPAAADAFDAALRLWRGRPLAELAEWAPAIGEVVRLDEERRAVMEDLAEAELGCGRHCETVASLEQLVVDEPLRERRWSLLMLALHRSGRQADALRAFQRARHALGELGLEPSRALRDLERAMGTDGLALPLEAAPPLSGRYGTIPVRTNLREPLTTFIGRERQLVEIADVLTRSRTVTLTGLGGAGKSRIAIEVARAAMATHPDGVWMVELAATRDGASIPTLIAAVIGLEVQPNDSSESVVSRLRTRLGRERTLLMLDNCEHLVQSVAELAHALAASCPGLTLLATSQESLGFPGDGPSP